MTKRFTNNKYIKERLNSMITNVYKNHRKPVNFSLQVEAGDLDTFGYAEISNSEGSFAGATVPALASATYDIDITVNGTKRKLAVALLNTDTWAGICTKIQAALRTATSALETVAIVSGKIRVSSVQEGGSSAVVIEAGTTGSGGGDLIAAITALTGYAAHIDTPVNGIEGTLMLDFSEFNLTDFIITSLLVRTSAHVVKSGIKAWFDSTNKIMYITDNGSTTELESGDIVNFSGIFVQ